MINAPTKLPHTVPSPPARLAPPMITAAITSNSAPAAVGNFCGRRMLKSTKTKKRPKSGPRRWSSVDGFLSTPSDWWHERPRERRTSPGLAGTLGPPVVECVHLAPPPAVPRPTGLGTSRRSGRTPPTTPANNCSPTTPPCLAPPSHQSTDKSSPHRLADLPTDCRAGTADHPVPSRRRQARAPPTTPSSTCSCRPHSRRPTPTPPPAPPPNPHRPTRRWLRNSCGYRAFGDMAGKRSHA